MTMRGKPTFSDSHIEMIRSIVQDELTKPSNTLVMRPAMSGRKLHAERVKISGSVDRAIKEALRLKARELRVPVGVIIEPALYEYLGRPKLSLELETGKEGNESER